MLVRPTQVDMVNDRQQSSRAATDRARREELAAFLLARREALQPEDLGIPRTGRRRVKGLRRREVADAASVSVTWYTWLEQGRDIRATRQAIEALARTLRLDNSGHRHLQRLAGISPSEVDGGLVRTIRRPG